MRKIGLGMCWDDLIVGEEFRTIGRTITETDLVNFINTTGMVEVLFTDVEFLKAHGPVNGRVVPGALAYCMAEGLLVQSMMQETGLAFLHMEFNVKGPTFVGDTIQARPTSKGRGLVRTRNRIVTQRNETVIEYTPLRMMAGRSDASRT